MAPVSGLACWVSCPPFGIFDMTDGCEMVIAGDELKSSEGVWVTCDEISSICSTLGSVFKYESGGVWDKFDELLPNPVEFAFSYKKIASRIFPTKFSLSKNLCWLWPFPKQSLNSKSVIKTPFQVLKFGVLATEN